MWQDDTEGHTRGAECTWQAGDLESPGLEIEFAPKIAALDAELTELNQLLRTARFERSDDKSLYEALHVSLVDIENRMGTLENNMVAFQRRITLMIEESRTLERRFLGRAMLAKGELLATQLGTARARAKGLVSLVDYSLRSPVPNFFTRPPAAETPPLPADPQAHPAKSPPRGRPSLGRVQSFHKLIEAELKPLPEEEDWD